MPIPCALPAAPVDEKMSFASSVTFEGSMRKNIFSSTGFNLFSIARNL
jgi:hypothetical protein